MKLRFSIRDLLWLTLVVGMAVAWWLDHQQTATLHKKYQSNIHIILSHLTGTQGLPLAKLDYGSDESINYYAESILKGEKPFQLHLPAVAK